MLYPIELRVPRGSRLSRIGGGLQLSPSQLRPDFHEDLAEIIFAFAAVGRRDAPDLVIPGVAFFKISVAGREEPFAQVVVMRELVADDVFHHGEFGGLPVVAKLER